MDHDELRVACLALPGSRETYPFGWQWQAFKVQRKIFALSRVDLDPVSVSLKCEPLLAEQPPVIAMSPASHFTVSMPSCVLGLYAFVSVLE